MDDRRPISQAADETGINRNTISRWVKAGKLKATTKMVGNLQATLVSLAEVKAIVAKGVKPGRPKKSR